jgi:hypothetical protein
MVKMEIQRVVDQLPPSAMPLFCEGLVASLELEIRGFGDQLVPPSAFPLPPAFHLYTQPTVAVSSCAERNLTCSPTPPNR